MARRNLILDRYRPLGKAGEGGFSTVIAAFDTHLKRNVAIKVIELDEETARRLAWSMGIATPEPQEPPTGRASRRDAARLGWRDARRSDAAPSNAANGGNRGEGSGSASAQGAPYTGSNGQNASLTSTNSIRRVVLPWEEDPVEVDAFGNVVDEGPLGSDGYGSPRDGEADCGDYDNLNRDDYEGFGEPGYDDLGYGDYDDYGDLDRGDQAGFGQGDGAAIHGAGSASGKMCYPEDPAFLDEGELDLSSEGLANLPDTTPSRLITHEGSADASTLPGLSEAQVAGNLGSPNIVAVYDLQLEGTTAYLIMEYVDGTSLADLLVDHDEDITLDIIAAVADGVANALEVAHRNNVLHLDIKPGNILIDKQGQVKVTDFGMAAVPDAQGNRHGEGGTIGYMPPEQMDRENLDERCDEWALASVIYQMLAGENPFEAPNLEAARAVIRGAELVVPSLMWEDLDDQADDVLFYALDPDRDERYETVGDFAEEIIPFLGKPKRGQKELAALLSPQDDEDDEDAGEFNRVEREPVPRIPLRERLTPELGNIASRTFAFLATAAIMAASMANMPQGSTTAAIVMWVLVAVGAGAAAAMPALGPLFAYASLAFALTLSGAVVPAATLIVATGAWWAFAAVPRRARAAANIGVAPPLLGGAFLSPLAPLLAGYHLTVGKAAATGAFSFVVAVVLGSLGSRSLASWDPLGHMLFASSSIDVTDGFLFLVTQPSTWVVGASWVLAGVVLSLCCSRGKRWLAAIGAVAAGCLLAAGLVAARMLATGGAELVPAPAALAGVVASAAIAFACCCVLIPEDAAVCYGEEA